MDPYRWDLENMYPQWLKTHGIRLSLENILIIPDNVLGQIDLGILLGTLFSPA